MESADVVKSSDHKQKAILIISFLSIWAFCLIVFWFFTDPTDALSYSIMILGVLLPVSIFIYSLIIGLNDYWGKRKWFSALAFGVIYMLSEYATFSAANMASAHHFNSPELDMIVEGVVVSTIGLAVGSPIYYLRRKRKRTDIRRFQETHGNKSQPE